MLLSLIKCDINRMFYHTHKLVSHKQTETTALSVGVVKVKQKASLAGL